MSQLKTFTFTIISRNANGDADELSERLYASGGSDTTLSLVGKDAWVEFCRPATTLGEALVTAIQDLDDIGLRVDDVQVHEDEDGPSVFPDRESTWEADITSATSGIRMIEEAIIEHYGTRCPDFAENCPACQVWKRYDELRDAENSLAKSTQRA